MQLKIMMKKMMKRVCVFTTVSAIVLSMTACNKGGGQDQGSNTTGESGKRAGVVSEYTYVAEFKDVNLKENADIFNLQLVDGKLYYATQEVTEEASGTVIYVQSAEDQKDLGNVRIDTTGDENTYSYVPMFAVRPDGGVYVMKSVNRTVDDTDKTDIFCYLYDASYHQIAEVDLRKELNIQDDYFYASRMLCDKNNRLYIVADTMIYLFDENLQYQGNVDLNGVYPSLYGMAGDGKVYVGYTDYALGDNVVMSVEFDKRELGERHTDFVSGYGVFTSGIEGDILVSDGSEVCDYHLQSNTRNLLFSWLDCDIMGSNIRSLEKLSDGRLVAFLDSDEMGQPDSLVYLTKKKSSEVAQKKQITVATLYADYELKAAAIAFNKQSSEYHVGMKTFDSGVYSEEWQANALSALNNAITAGEGIDVVQVNDLTNLHALASKGVFEDLGAYLDKNGGRSAYLDNLLEAGTVDGKLVFIPKYFELNTFVGKTSLVGKESGWTMEDLLKLSKAHPDAKMFNWSGKDDALDVCLTFTGEEFIDEATGKCNFDSDDFKRILEFVNSFPDSYNWDNVDDENPVEKLRNDQLLLEKVYVYNIGNLQVYPDEFGEAVTYIGYPTADGSAANLLLFNSPNLAISSKSADKDGAWKFVEFYLNYTNGLYGNGMSSKKADLEKAMQEKMKPQYATDENGEMIKDENGQPILSLGSTWYGDWSYEYHVSTQAEMDEEYKVITEARASRGIDEQILSIIKEEAAAYFAKQKSVDDVAGVIQSRVQLYVNENR